MNVEKIVISKAVLGEAYVQKFINAGIMPIHFQNSRNQEIYNYVIKTRKEQGYIPSAKELDTLFKFIPDPDTGSYNSVFIIESFKRHFKCSTLTRMLAESSALADDPDEAGKIIQKHMSEIHTQFAVARDVDLSKSVPNVLKACRETLLKGGVTGLKTPWAELDRAIGGFNPEEFFLLTGRPKSGKCIAKGTLITLTDGTQMPIEEAVEKRIPELPSFDGLSFVNNPVVDWLYLGKKDCLKITTRSGRSVTCATTHPMLTMRGYERAQKLTTNDFLAVPRGDVSSEGFIKKPWQEIYLTALLIADGCLRHKGYVTFTKADKELVSLARLASLKFGARLTKAKSADYAYSIINKVRTNKCSKLFTFIEALGLMGKKSETKFLPSFVFRLPPQQKALFMATLINTDGCICQAPNGMAYMEYSSSSERLADDVQHLLCLMGIRSTKQRHDTKCLPSYRISVYSNAMASLMILCEAFLIKRKISVYKNANNLTRKEKDNDVIVLSKEHFNKIRQDMLNTGLPFKTILGIEGKPNVTRYGQGKPISVSLLTRIAASVPSDTLERILATELFYDKIVLIKPVGQKECYDFSVGVTHNYVASDFVSHNSWMALYMAAHCVKEGHVVLFVSKEMSQRLLERRYIGMRAGVPYNELKSGKLTTHSKFKMNILSNKLRTEKGKFILIEDDISADTGVAFIDSKIEEHKPDIVFIDGVYLLADDNGSTDERPRLRNISRDCKRMAHRRKIPVGAVLQMNRDKVSKSTGEGGMNAVYGTDGFMQDTDWAVEIIRNRELDDERCRLFKIVAAREGENLAMKIPFDLDKYSFNQVYDSSNEEAPEEGEVELR